MSARELLEQLRIDLKRSIDSIIDEAIQRAEKIVQQKAVNCDAITEDAGGRPTSLSSQTVSDDEKDRTLSEEDSIVLDCSHAQLPLQQGNSQDNESGDAKKGEGAKTSSLVSPILPRRRKRGLKREVHDMKTTEAAECSPSDDDGSLPSTPSPKSPSYSFPPENTTVPFACQKSASLNETP
ncbi:hypothetical protein WA556_002286, partial [Blastocystis sp. ATCC 50177/Nand II]